MKSEERAVKPSVLGPRSSVLGPRSSVLGPSVSVLVPVYNDGATLPRAVDSLLAQEYPVREIIVVDDGSEEDIAGLVQARYGDRVQCLRQEHRGPGAARNTALRQATGDLIAFLDADDEWRPEKASRQVEYLQAHPEIAAVGTGRVWRDDGHSGSGGQAPSRRATLGDDGNAVRGGWGLQARRGGGGGVGVALIAGERRVSHHPCGPGDPRSQGRQRRSSERDSGERRWTQAKEISFREEIWRNWVCGASVMVRREVLERHGGYDEAIRVGEDRDLWLRMLAAGDRIVNLKERLYVFYRRPATRRSDLRERWASHERILRKWDPAGNPQAAELLAPMRYADVRRWWLLRTAAWAARQGDRALLRELLAEARGPRGADWRCDALWWMGRVWPGGLGLVGRLAKGM